MKVYKSQIMRLIAKTLLRPANLSFANSRFILKDNIDADERYRLNK